jgi:hypothetical protein
MSDQIALNPAQRMKLLGAVANNVAACRQRFLRGNAPRRGHDTAGNFALGLLTLIEVLGTIPIYRPAEVLDEDADAWVAAYRALWEAVSDIHGARGRLADFAAVREFVPFSWNGDSYPSACHAAFVMAENVLRRAWWSIRGKGKPFPVPSLDSPSAGAPDSPGEFDPALWRRVPFRHGVRPIPLLDTSAVSAAIRQELAALQMSSPVQAPGAARKQAVEPPEEVTDSGLGHLAALWALADLRALYLVAARAKSTFRVSLDRCPPGPPDWDEWVPYRVMAGELKGASAVVAILQDLENLGHGYDAIRARIGHEWIRVRQFRHIQWRGETWSSGHGAILELLEEALREVPRPDGTTDEATYLATLLSWHRRMFPDTSVLEAAAEQEYAVLKAEDYAGQCEGAGQPGSVPVATAALPAVLDRPAGLEAPGAADQRPRWDRERRELWLGDILCKRYKRPAPNQEKVWDAFEEDNWPPRLDDPLEPGKLRATLADLQEAVRASPIAIEGDGTGQGILWSRRLLG